MKTNPCPHCQASLPAGARFCRACDRPIVDGDDSRLSVADSVPVSNRSRWLGLLVVVLVLGGLGAVSYGAIHMVQSKDAASAAHAASDARRGLELLVRAEGGDARACKTTTAYVAGTRKGVRQECVATVDHDPGARLEHVTTTKAHLGNQTGSVHLTATVVDDHGSRSYDRTLQLVDQSGQWMLNWNGRPAV